MPKEYTILIADDEVELCHILKKVLDKAGYNTLTATGGQQALELLQSEKIDLLILDLKMPGLDGIGVLTELSKRALKSSPKVVVVTAHGSLSSAREAMSLGAVDYMTKPFDLEVVKAVVREALSDA